MTAKGQPVIIVKKRAHHGGHHGGAWKVAYADFVTAMMAFFLVMWLVGQSKAVRSGVGGYFRDPAVFEAQGGRGVLPGSETASPNPSEKSVGPSVERKALEAAVEHITARLATMPDLKTLRNQLEFTVTSEGLRIELLETDESSFFDSGSAVPRGETERILGVIAPELSSLDQAVVIEGHTDSRPYVKNDRYSNWELSSDRANAARRVMEKQGLLPTQVESIRGLADRQLRVSADPTAARNRRVSILVKAAANGGRGGPSRAWPQS